MNAVFSCESPNVLPDIGCDLLSSVLSVLYFYLILCTV